jgi:nicotinate-nucleotide--dimethylbenzimidazole phosphoribosyltransferase
MARKASVIRQGVELHRDARGLGVLAALGGREQAAICGRCWPRGRRGFR